MKPHYKSCKGSLTMQFMIALVLIIFFVMSFLGLALTLSYASLTQYLTYASARKLSLGGINKADQEQAGKEKYTDLRGNLFGNAFQPGSTDWFGIPNQISTGLNVSYDPQEQTSGKPGERNLFYGAWVAFQSKVTSFKIPMLTDKSDGNLRTLIGSYLGREPSEQECEDFFQATPTPPAWFRIKYSQPSYSGTSEMQSPLPPLTSDNGC